jgi:predicted Zn-dependent protease
MSQAVQAGSPSRENKAWCLVEFGDMLFKIGRVADAETAYRQALHAFPGYHRANAALSRLLASAGDYKKAIASMLSAQMAVPLPEYASSLEHLYRRTGEADEARHQQQLIDVMDKLMAPNGETTNRNLALIFADDDRQLDRALELAKAEFAVRGDVYTYDALAWTLFKKKRYREAEEASYKAIAFNTPEPVFFYHAAQIALALGKKGVAQTHLDRVRSLNSKFDFRYTEKLEELMAQMKAAPFGG